MIPPIKNNLDLLSATTDSVEKMGLDLRNLDTGDKEAKIKKVSIQFEQMLIDQLLKSAFKDESEDRTDEDEAPLMTFGPVNDFKVMLMSQHISENGGLGYREVIERQIREKLSGGEGIPTETPKRETNATHERPRIESLPKTASSKLKTGIKLNLKPLELVAPVNTSVTSEFGWRHDPINGHLRFHKGVDFKAALNTPVKSVMEGEVTFSGWQEGYGNLVEVTHPDGHISRYGHNATLLVAKGDKVGAGAVIALSGSTGRSTGPHLHFEIRKENVAEDPIKFLAQNKINVFEKNSEIRDAGA
ncbi:MAG: peptidoglycan DD-metalloendopeptidase family protein [Candidatus Omnitrophota bacterium]